MIGCSSFQFQKGNLRAEFEDTSRPRTCAVGGLPHGWSYDMLEDVDTRVMLLELPTTKMFGWQWGDVKNVVLSLPRVSDSKI